jgi:ubiquinone/menaquinone biosynthesis C-methylase UbiE
MNLAVNFRHGIAEDTKFPDNHFDLVTDHIMFHEVTAAAAKKIVAETFRILRPGGIFHHVDVPTEGHPHAQLSKTIPGKAATWSNHRYNHEPWFLQYSHTDFPGLLRSAGFTVDFEGDPNRRNMYPKVIAIKPV